MRVYNGDDYKNIAILGSFGKHYDLIVDISKKFIDSGFKVLVPRISGVKDKNSSFLILVGDNSSNPKQLELDYLNKCLEADLVYVCNKVNCKTGKINVKILLLSVFIAPRKSSCQT